MITNLDCLKLLNFIETSNFFTTNQIRSKKILIAFSGGQDSFCLLTVFIILCKKWEFELGVVYCNHCWKDSSETSLAVFQILENFNIPFYFVESPNSKPMKPEQKARIWRYSSFYTISKWEKYDFVLTGHTLSDCAETVLFNLFRGTGLKGICSLKEYQTFEMVKPNPFFFKQTTFETRSSFPSNFFEKKKFKGNFFFNSFYCAFITKNPFLPFSPYLKELAQIDHFDIPLISLSFRPKVFKTKNFIKRRLFYTYVETQKLKDLMVKKNVKSLHLKVSAKSLNSSNFVLGVQARNLPFIKVGLEVRKIEKFVQRAKVQIFKDKKKPRVLKSNNKIFQNFFLLLKPRENQDTNLFDIYIKNLKHYQKIDKLSSFITVFKPKLKKDHSSFFNAKIESLIKKKCNLLNKQKGLQHEKQNKEMEIIAKLNLANKLQTNSLELTDKNEEFLIFRPFIKINRQTLFLFSKQLKLPVHYDKSNKDLNISRNYIRKVILPLLKKMNPKVEDSLYKFSRIIEFYYEFIGDLECPSTRFDIFNP